MKPLFVIGIVLGQAAVVLAAFKAGQVIKASQAGTKVWEAYPRQVPPGVALNPVPLNVENRNAGIILRGSYIVNGLQHCNSCHTCPPYAIGGEQFALGAMPPINSTNYLAGGRHFGAADTSGRRMTPTHRYRPTSHQTRQQDCLAASHFSSFEPPSAPGGRTRLGAACRSCLGPCSMT